MSQQHKPLQDVVARYSRELQEITKVWESVGDSALVNSFSVPYAPAEDGCVVALWDAWNRFVRDLLITCAGGSTLGLDGAVYHPASPRSATECLATLADNRGRVGQLIGGEPHWYKVNKIADLAALFELQNADTIVSAIGSTDVYFGSFVAPNPLEEIRRCRNFTAHKAAHTLKDVRNYIGTEFHGLRPHLSRKRRGSAVFYEWVDGCQSIAAAAAR